MGGNIFVICGVEGVVRKTEGKGGAICPGEQTFTCIVRGSNVMSGGWGVIGITASGGGGVKTNLQPIPPEDNLRKSP